MNRSYRLVLRLFLLASSFGKGADGFTSLVSIPNASWILKKIDSERVKGYSSAIYSAIDSFSNPDITSDKRPSRWVHLMSSMTSSEESAQIPETHSTLAKAALLGAGVKLFGELKATPLSAGFCNWVIDRLNDPCNDYYRFPPIFLKLS
jgi:hypothetical protein